MNFLELLSTAYLSGWLSYLLYSATRLSRARSADERESAQRGMVTSVIAGVVIVVAPSLVKAFVGFKRGTVSSGYPDAGEDYWYVGSKGEIDPDTGIPANALPPDVSSMAWKLINWSIAVGAFIIIGGLIWNAIKLAPVIKN